MPGPVERKAALFRNMRDHLSREGVLYGTTVLGRGVTHNWFGSYLMKAYNRSEIFGNLEDSEEGFAAALRENFEEVETWVEGVVMLFTARGPKNPKPPGARRDVNS